MGKMYEQPRLPERVYVTASELRMQLNNGEPDVAYVKIAGDLLSSLHHQLNQRQFHGDTTNTDECRRLCDLVGATVPHLDDRDGMSTSIRNGLLEQKDRCERVLRGT